MLLLQGSKSAHVGLMDLGVVDLLPPERLLVSQNALERREGLCRSQDLATWPLLP